MTRFARFLFVAALGLAACRFSFDRSLSPGELRGRLVAEDDRGQRTPITDASVAIVGSAANVKTDSTGLFTFRGLTSGTYSLRVSRKLQSTDPAPTTVLRVNSVAFLPDAKGVLGQDLGTIVVTGLGGITGTVTRNGEPVTGASVFVKDLDQRTVTATGFSFDSVPPGNYELYVVDEHGQLLKGSSSALTATVQARQRTMLSIQLESLTPAAAGTVSGTVHLNDTSSPAGVAVRLVNDTSITMLGATDSSGHYSKDGVPAGVYDLVASKDGYTSAVASYVIIDGNTAIPDLLLVSLQSKDLAATCGTTPDDPATTGCDVDATCTDRSGTRVCTCDAGFAGNGFVCSDVDECASGTAACDPHATCTNTLGSYDCACNEGYLGDGKTCTPDDPCLVNNGGCDPTATCTVVEGAPECDCGVGFYMGENGACAMCGPGYTGDGHTCHDIDECRSESAMCPANAFCTNTPGSYTCTCDTGWQDANGTCVDIDECATGMNNCTGNTLCHNLPGSYGCDVSYVPATGSVAFPEVAAFINGQSQSFTLQLNVLDPADQPIAGNGPLPLREPIIFAITSASNAKVSPAYITDLSTPVAVFYDGTDQNPITVEMTTLMSGIKTSATLQPGFPLTGLAFTQDQLSVVISGETQKIPLQVSAMAGGMIPLPVEGATPLATPLTFSVTPVDDSIMISPATITDLTTPVILSYNGYGTNEPYTLTVSDGTNTASTTLTPLWTVESAGVTLSSGQVIINGQQQTLTGTLYGLDLMDNGIDGPGALPLNTTLKIVADPGLTVSPQTVTDLATPLTVTYDGKTPGSLSVYVSGGNSSPATVNAVYHVKNITPSAPAGLRLFVDHTAQQFAVTLTGTDSNGNTISGAGPLPLDTALTFQSDPPGAFTFNPPSVTDLSTPVTAIYNGYDGPLLDFYLTGAVSDYASLIGYPTTASIALSADLSKPLQDYGKHTITIKVSGKDTFGQPLSGAVIASQYNLQFGTDAQSGVTLSTNGIGDLNIPLTVTYDGSPTGSFHITASMVPNEAPSNAAPLTASITITPTYQYLFVLHDAGLDILDTNDGSQVAHLALPAGSQQLTTDLFNQRVLVSNSTAGTISEISYVGFPAVTKTFSSPEAAGVVQLAFDGNSTEYALSTGGLTKIDLSAGTPTQTSISPAPQPTGGFDSMLVSGGSGNCVFWNEWQPGRIGAFDTAAGKFRGYLTPATHVGSVAVGPGGANLYVADASASKLYEYPIASDCSLSAPATIDFTQLGGIAQAPLFYSPNTAQLYATTDAGTILGIDPGTHAVTQVASQAGASLSRATTDSASIVMYVYDSVNQKILGFNMSSAFTPFANWPATDVKAMGVAPMTAQ